MRNDLLVEWMRRPMLVALRSSGALTAPERVATQARSSLVARPSPATSDQPG
jgi:hypothetical protein